jgi:hypothetical protein
LKGKEKKREKEKRGVEAYGLGLGHDGVAHGEEGQEVAHGLRLVGVLRVEGGQQLLPVEPLVGLLQQRKTCSCVDTNVITLSTETTNKKKEKW